ncbi:MAG: hypothetical protein WKG01_03750 [Kofleriaceae bacterium]
MRLATITDRLEGVTLTVGTSKVVISKIGSRDSKIEDACELRQLDGQTWWWR